MKIADDLYLETRVYSKDNKEAYLVNDKTGKEVKIASVFIENKEWLVGDLYRFLVEPSKKEAMTTFNYIVAMTADNIKFLFNQ